MCTRIAIRCPSSSCGSSTASESGIPTDPSLPSGEISTRRTPAWWPSVLNILASNSCSTCSRRPSRRICETPISRSTWMGSQRGSYSLDRPLTASSPSSSAWWRSSRSRYTLFSRVSGVHSKSWTSPSKTAAVTFTDPRAPFLLSSQCIFVSRRRFRCSSAHIRFASFTSGITNIRSSSSFCMQCSCCRWSSSSVAAFWARFSRSLIRRLFSSSACFCRSSNSRCSRSSSLACSATAAWSLATVCACCSSFSRSHSCCFSSSCLWNSSSRSCSLASASDFALALASSASRTRRSSSSAMARFSSSSCSEGPLTPPWWCRSSFRAIA
mmetsp:Transcript_115556/g.327467  ORF Transcript_115556/g.327467 Transcript_115556/m.327467 type:complete len:326 (+) Transcript_115556:762-1739(+)